MGHTYTNLNYHLIFSTKGREPLLAPAHRPRIYGYIGGIIRDLKGSVIAIGGTEDHVHILCQLGTTVPMADALRQIKGSSSKWMNDEVTPRSTFAWQTGYAAFSVSQSNIGSVERYIERQEEHHKQKSFKEELLDFLRKHNVNYDEQYLWD